MSRAFGWDRKTAAKRHNGAMTEADHSATGAKPATWGGRTTAQRRSERRGRLIDAATDIWCESGWAAVTMRGVCSRAGLTDRYFYESFADRDALLAAIWDDILDRITETLGAIMIEGVDRPVLEVFETAVRTVVEQVAADPRRAPILFGMHSGSDALEQRRHAMVLRMSEILLAGTLPRVDPRLDRAQLRRSVLMGVGGFIELVMQWRAGEIDGDAQTVIDQTVHFGTVLGAYYVPDDPDAVFGTAPTTAGGETAPPT